MQPIRQYERFSVDFKDVHGKILFRSNVNILNISVGGVSFCSDKLLEIGGTYVLRLESKGKTLHLRGTIIWTKLNGDTKSNKIAIQTYNVGMQFSHSSVTRDKEIKQFIKDNCKDNQKLKSSPSVISDARIHVRLLIDEPDEAMIYCAEDYKVKKIGQNGMLIESSNIMPIEDLLPMEMELPENRLITLRGRIVTCESIQDKYPPRYDIGIEFIDMSERDTKILKEFIASLQK